MSPGLDRGDAALSVVIVTKNRPESLVRCVKSLALIDSLVTEILIVDDAGDVPILEALQAIPPSLRDRIRFSRQPAAGYIGARNTMLRSATNDFALSLDDDAFLVDGAGIRRGIDLLAAAPRVAAVAFAQTDMDGTPWHASMQPAPVSYVCYVAAFIGFATLVRRRLFVELGGYQEGYVYYSEEKDYCLRALDAGYRIVYMPDVRVAHVPDPSGRSQSRYIRHVIRNDCLFALYNEPFPMPLLTIPMRLARFFAMRRQGRMHDPGAFRWILREIVSSLPDTWRKRKPVRWATLRQWRRIGRERPAYRPGGARLTTRV